MRWIVACAVVVCGPVAAVIAGEPIEAVLFATRGDERIHIMSAEDLSTIAEIDAGLGAHELRASADGRWIVGTAYGGPGAGHQPADHRIVVIDARAGTVHRVIELEGLSRPNDVAFLPCGREAIVTVEQPPGLVRVDVEEGTYEFFTLDTGANHMLALSPDGRRAYVAHVMPGSLSCVDTGTGALIGRLDLPAGAEGIACSPDGSRVWVACNRSNTLVVVDARAWAVEARLDCPGFPFRVRAAPDGSVVGVVCPGTGEVALYEDAERARRIDLRAELGEPGVMPVGLAFTSSGDRLGVLCDGPRPQVVVLDARDGSIVQRRRIEGALPDAFASARLAMPDGATP